MLIASASVSCWPGTTGSDPLMPTGIGATEFVGTPEAAEALAEDQIGFFVTTAPGTAPPCTAKLERNVNGRVHAISAKTRQYFIRYGLRGASLILSNRAKDR